MPQTAQEKSGGSLGTFAGVFTPSALTILGIILFLRLGYVTGSAGIGWAILIIVMANAISVLTSISLSAIATNLRVKGGGDYYLISRTLGVEYGGALGLVLFIAQSVSIAFYCIGFGEALSAMLPERTTERLGSLVHVGVLHISFAQIVAALAVAALFVLAWLGSDWATRFQYVVMGVLALAIAAFFIGGLPQWSLAQLLENVSPAIQPQAIEGGALSLPFWTVFALFFPAVTGFTQGVSMSGDLSNPGRSLPMGTFLAVGVSIVVYLGAAIVFAGAMNNADLVSDYGAMRRVSAVPWLVDAGVIAATLSSALASFLGAPRILQSLSRDRIFKVLNPFAVGTGESDNPRRGVLLSTIIAFITIALGDLNVIAPVVSMFFLISYGLLNYATYVEASASSPSFRPRFRWFNAKLSLLGGVACLAVMLAIHPLAALTSVLLLIVIYRYISSSVDVDRWADSGRSQRFQRMRDDLHAIASELEHPRYWRPVLVAFSDDPERRKRLLRFASWIEGGSGLTTLVQFVTGEGPRVRRERDRQELELRQEIERQGLRAFSRVIVTGRGQEAMPLTLQSYGLGPVRANTMLLNWVDRRKGDGDLSHMRRFGERLRIGLRHGCNVIVVSAHAGDFEKIERSKPRQRRIDVWYRDNASGRMMLMLAYLMTRTDTWSDARIRLHAVVDSGGDEETLRERLREMLDDVRIVADVEIVAEAGTRVVVERSLDACAVLLPITVTEDGPRAIYGDLGEMLPALGLTALVVASQDIELDAAPEEGRHGEIAQAMDEAQRTAKAVSKIERESRSATKQLETLREKLDRALADNSPEEEKTAIEEQIKQAIAECERHQKRAAKAQAKAETAAEDARGATGDSAKPGAEEPE